MNGLAESYRQKRIAEQMQPTPPRERWLHLPTNKEYLLVLEVGGACELEGIDRRCTYQRREALEGSDAWRRLP